MKTIILVRRRIKSISVTVTKEGEEYAQTWRIVGRRPVEIPIYTDFQ